MAGWQDNPANNSLTGKGQWYDDPMAQDELMFQKLQGMNLPPEQIQQIMQQVKQADSLKSKSAMTDGLPIGQGDTLSAQEGYAGPPGPAMPNAEAQISDGGPAGGAEVMGPPAGAGVGTGASAGAAPSAGESIYDRLGADGMEAMLGQGSIDDQLASAQALRDKDGPKGMYTKNMYVSANPLSHIASAVEKHRAKKDIKDLRGKEKEGNRTIIDLLRGNKTTKNLTPDEIAKAEGWDKPEDEDVGFGLGRGR